MSESSLASVFFGIFFVLAFPFFLVGIPLGFAALLYACCGRMERARRLGWYCVAVGGALGAWLASVSVGLEFPYHWLFATPAALGGLALAHAHFYRDSPPLTGFQFTLPMLLYVTLFAGIAAAAANVWLIDHADYSESRQIEANLARIPSITNVSCDGSITNDKFVVRRVTFSLAGRPDTRIAIASDYRLRDCEASDPLSQVVLCELGDWRLQGKFDFDQSLTVPFAGLNVGLRGDLAPELPFPVHSIDDLVDRYDELNELLKTWPRADQPKRLDRDRFPYDYWVERNVP